MEHKWVLVGTVYECSECRMVRLLEELGIDEGGCLTPEQQEAWAEEERLAEVAQEEEATSVWK